uniref:Uncharacterized protein n=1 Tax=Oryza rufipogon TaxID=4529 RepID=A0A0E0PV40_ORYRU
MPRGGQRRDDGRRRHGGGEAHTLSDAAAAEEEEVRREPRGGGHVVHAELGALVIEVVVLCEGMCQRWWWRRRSDVLQHVKRRRRRAHGGGWVSTTAERRRKQVRAAAKAGECGGGERVRLRMGRGGRRRLRSARLCRRRWLRARAEQGGERGAEGRVSGGSERQPSPRDGLLPCRLLAAGAHRCGARPRLHLRAHLMSRVMETDTSSAWFLGSSLRVDALVQEGFSAPST